MAPPRRGASSMTPIAEVGLISAQMQDVIVSNVTFTASVHSIRGLVRFLIHTFRVVSRARKISLKAALRGRRKHSGDAHESYCANIGPLSTFARHSQAHTRERSKGPHPDECQPVPKALARAGAHGSFCTASTATACTSGLAAACPRCPTTAEGCGLVLARTPSESHIRRLPALGPKSRCDVVHALALQCMQRGWVRRRLEGAGRDASSHVDSKV